jgi:hypothetical protein
VDRWGELWASAIGLPDVPDPEGARLGDRAVVFAGFRDEYYGLVPAVREHAPGDDPAAAAPLVTSGVIDWGTCAWGARPVRFAKRRWQAPVVDLGLLAASGPGSAARWVERTRRPKLVVATQTRTLEAAVDEDGAWIPSVPALAVVPDDPGELWHLGAALAAPAATAWLVRRAAGTGLERGAVRVSGPGLAALPLPPDARAWDGAADALRAYAAGPGEAARERFLAVRPAPTAPPRRSPSGGGRNRVDRPAAARASVSPNIRSGRPREGPARQPGSDSQGAIPVLPGMRLCEEQPSVRAPLCGRAPRLCGPEEATWPDPYTRPVRHPARRPGTRLPARRGP